MQNSTKPSAYYIQRFAIFRHHSKFLKTICDKKNTAKILQHFLRFLISSRFCFSCQTCLPHMNQHAWPATKANVLRIILQCNQLPSADQCTYIYKAAAAVTLHNALTHRAQNLQQNLSIKITFMICFQLMVSGYDSEISANQWMMRRQSKGNMCQDLHDPQFKYHCGTIILKLVHCFILEFCSPIN